MKIRRIQITMEPAPGGRPDDNFKTFTVQVWADGQTFSSQSMMYESDFRDAFGFAMKDAERRIRDMVAGKTPEGTSFGEIRT